jgi:CheY-like chemotaxis protein
VAAAFRPEIVLVDICLPQLNGYQVARRLRRLEGIGMTLVVTGEDDRQKAPDVGFNYRLTKPIEPARLKRMLATLKDVDRLT